MTEMKMKSPLSQMTPWEKLWDKIILENTGGWTHCALQVQAPNLQINFKQHLRVRDLINVWRWSKKKIKKKEFLLTFCQFFFKRETRKLTLIWTFWKICFSSMPRFPTATPMQRTFLSWNFTVAFVSFTLDSKDSWWLTRVGNFPVCLLFKASSDY